jgi:hypothetical protein
MGLGGGGTSLVASPLTLSPPAVNPPQADSTTFPDALNFNPTLNTGLAGAGNTFDPFGFGGDGTPSLFPPDGIFDWGAR